MLNASGLPYLIARATSAAGNFLAVAVFSRMAGPAEYGHYVLIFAWSLIVYGFSAQWMRFAYFGVYQSPRLAEYVGSLARLLAGSLALMAVALVTLGLLGLFEPAFLGAIFALTCGMTVYEAAFEVSRTMLDVRRAALSMVLRTTLTLALGSAGLWLGGGPYGLAVAIAIAHVMAAIPSLGALSDLRWSKASLAAVLHIIEYGWPLLLSFGVNAAGASIDRLLLAHFLGTATLGPYGVVADVLRQSFTVLGEAIMLSLVTVAKQQVNENELNGANATLQQAFNACLAAAVFGAAFFMVFGDVVLRSVFGPEFIAPIRDLIPIFAIAFAFMIMRNYYFAQVIYFTHASYLELLVSLLFFAVSATLSLALVPSYGPRGAAAAVMLAYIISGVAFMVMGRRVFRMPIDLTALGIMPTLAVLFIFGTRMAHELFASATIRLILDALVFALIGGFAIHRFGLLSAPADARSEVVPVR